MLEAAKSIAGFEWAAALFGLRQVGSLVSSNGLAKAGTAFYRVIKAVQREFEGDALLYGINQIGEEVQRSGIDFGCDLLRLKPFNPRWAGQTASAALTASFDAAHALTPGDNLSATLALLGNTLGVINLVNRAASTLDLPAAEIELAGAIERAYSFGEYASLWLVEGLGREYAGRHWSENVPPRGLLAAGQGSTLPDKSLLMMHAGMGISFARKAVAPLTPQSSRSEVGGALDRFIALVKNNAREGYEGPAFESLGLVTRTWFPEMILPIDGHLWNIGIPLVEYFWHGVGRAAYFNPRYLIPGSTPFQGIAKEAPHQLALLNGIAGAAWAFTLVNIKQPEILVNLLRNYAGTLEANDAFTNGVISTAIMASDVLPADPYARALSTYAPRTADSSLASAWDRLVRRPCQEALTGYFPILQKHRRLGEIFRYLDLDSTVKRLEAV